MYPAFVVTFDVPLDDDANPAAAAAASAAEGPAPKRARVAAAASASGAAAPSRGGAASNGKGPAVGAAAAASAVAAAAGPLHRGYAVGEKVYFTGASQTFADGDKITHGQDGEVAGPSTDGDPECLCVMFPGNKDGISCYLTRLSRSPPPPLPGGYAVGEKVYYTGESGTWDDGDKLTHGESGEVIGQPPSDDPAFGECVSVRFPGMIASMLCDLDEISRAPPTP